MLASPSGLDLSTSALRDAAAACGQQALLALAHLRGGHTYAHLAAGFAVGIATAHRYLAEAVQVLAALAPSLAQAAQAAATKALGILDGTLRPIDQIAADAPTTFWKAHEARQERAGHR